MPRRTKQTAKPPTADPTPAKDAHEQAILDALDRHLDPDLFEKCAVDMLSADFPSLAPVRGGSDGGFDGEVWTTAPNASPLVVTTQQDFVSNLRNSLAHAKQSGDFTVAVFATSRFVTPHMRRKLRSNARDFGVVQLRVYDKHWLASKLYRDSVWCMKLLGVTGRAHALARETPDSQSRCPLPVLLGRDEIIAALASHEGDSILVGGPGHGKTSVLRQLISQTNGYFAVAEDRVALANAIRDLQPTLIAVDDAALASELLRAVLEVRIQTGAHFRVVATCWDSQQDDLARRFGSNRPAVVHLKLLPADTMVEVVRAAGLHGPTELVRRIVRQAEGRPGLATTLTRAAFERGVGDVVTGQALLQYLEPTFRAHLNITATHLLGCFSVGGTRGMPMEVVANHLQRPLDDIANVLANLSAAGVIRDNNCHSISVWPMDLRAALVAKTFFKSPAMPLGALLAAAPDRRCALETMIGARAVGADVPDLEHWVEQASDRDLWAQFATLGEREARYALQQHPELIDEIADGALYHVPEEIVPLLLDEAVRDRDTAKLRTRLERWARGQKYSDVMLARSEALISATTRWFDRTRQGDVAINAACLALEPNYALTECDPGMGSRVQFMRGVFSAEELRLLTRNWPRLLRILQAVSPIPWREVLSLLKRWCQPEPGIPADEETVSELEKFSRLMVLELLPFAESHNAAKRRLRQLAASIGLDVTIPEDPAFAILYPTYTSKDYVDWQDAAQRHAMNARALAREWLSDPPEDVISRLTRFASEARDTGANWGSTVSVFASELARLCTDPLRYLEALVAAGLSTEVTWCFADRCCSSDRGGTVEFLLAVPNCASLALEMALLGDPVDLRAVDRCIAAVSAPERQLSLMLHHVFSVELARHLLVHKSRIVAASTAIALWHHSNRDKILEQVAQDWQCAFLDTATMERSAEDSHWIEQILRNRKDLALDWLRRYFGARKTVWQRLNDLAVVAARLMNNDERCNALSITPADYCVHDVLTALVGRNAQRFEHLLGIPRLERMHLLPLQGHPSASWITMATTALRHGHSERAVADATLSDSWSWSGNESEMWRGWCDAIEPYATHEDHGIRRIAELMLGRVQARRERCVQQELAEEIRGIHYDA